MVVFNYQAVLPAPTMASLVRRGAQLSKVWGTVDDEFEFNSDWPMENGRRGWSNWIIARRLMLGQYPGAQAGGPTRADSHRHLHRLLAAGVDCFACLQDEVPAQDEPGAWLDGEAQGFEQYASEANAIAHEIDFCAQSGSRSLTYLHCPIAERSTPADGLCENATVLALLDEMLSHFEGGGGAIYLHSWAGCSRAGLVGAIFLSLVQPGVEAVRLLERVQTAYDSRTSDALPMEACVSGVCAKPHMCSPQTEAQRNFVISFVSAAERLR